MMRLVALALGLGAASAVNERAVANPIRKVVTLLQKMEEKVKAEGEKEEELYKKFMCYCKTGVGELEGRIEAAGTKAPQLESDIKASEEKLVQTKQALKDAQKERSDAKTAVATAVEIREKDAKAFGKQKAELEGIIGQISSAVSALESGMAGSFLQAGTTTSALKKLAWKAKSVNDDDKETILSFLSGKSSYAPKSGEVTGILKQMGDEFAKTLKDAEDTEATAIKEHEALVAAKKKEIETLTLSIEQKLEQVGDLGTAIVQMKADFEDIAGNLLEDKKMLKELKAGCSTKDAEYEARVKTRTEELAALAETIKILNDDDALELFKKTLPAPSASLVQMQVSSSDLRTRALSLLQQARAVSSSQKSRLSFLVLALRGKKIGFDKVIVMIDDMVKLLKKEGQDDADKKEYCLSSIDQTEDKKKELDRKLADTETAIESGTEQVGALTEEIAKTEVAIKELDSTVKSATEIRKEENEEYKALVQNDSAAKELLLFAKNRLNKFYNPKLYKPPAKEELSDQGAIARDMAFVQIKVHRQLSNMEPPPETWDAYAKKSEESTGVIQMIDLLVQDLDKELTEAETDEKNAQEEYDRTMADAKDDRVDLSKTLKDRSATKADLESDIEGLKATKKSTTTELMATEKMLSDLHGECDWLLKYFDMRVNAREGEIDALGKAKAVLSGADYSLLQMSTNRLTQ